MTNEELFEKFSRSFEVNKWTPESGFDEPIDFYLHEIWKRNPVVQDLLCCGNCYHGVVFCEYGTIESGGYCSHWKSDEVPRHLIDKTKVNFFGDNIKNAIQILSNDKTSLKELVDNFLKSKKEIVDCLVNYNEPMDGNTEKYLVDCCNEDCGWAGYSTDCVCFKHDRDKLFCPECHEVVEPVE